MDATTLTPGFPVDRRRLATWSVRKAAAVCLARTLVGAGVFCAGYAASLALETGAVGCASAGMLLAAVHFGVLGLCAERSAQTNLG